MNKRVLTIGVILLALSASLIVVGRLDIILAQSNQPSTGDQTTSEYYLANNTNMGSIYSALTTALIITPGGSQQSQEFEIRMNIRFLDIAPGGCNVNQLCVINGVGGILSGDNALDTSTDHIFVLTVTESVLPVPFLMTGSNLDGLGNYEYVLSITSPDDFTFTHTEIVAWRILVPLGLILSLFSVLIVIFGLVRGGSTRRIKPLKQQPAFEPVLGGGSKSSAGSGRSGRSKRGSKKQSKQSRGRSSAGASSKSSSVKCRSCNLPIPRNSQYCPHCYTRQ